MWWPRSFKSRIVLLIIGILLAVTLAASAIVGDSVYRSMYESEMQASANAVRLMERNIEDRYSDLEYFRTSVMTARRRQLTDNTRNLVEAFDTFYGFSQTGRLSRRQAQTAALDYAGTVRFEPEGYFFIYDQHYTCIGHVDPQFIGQNLKDLRDADGVYVIRELMSAAQDPGGGFVNYLWQRPGSQDTYRKLGYAVWYPQWNWLVGTGVYIDDVDRAVEEALREMISGLAQTISRLRVAQTGSFLVFDHNGNVIAGPGREADRPPATSSDTSLKAEPLPGLQVEAIPEIAEGTHRVLEFRGALSADPGAAATDNLLLVRYYRPLGWYVAAVVNESELKAPGRQLLARLWTVQLIVVLCGVLLAWFTVKRVARPLDQLAAHIQELEKRDFQGTETPLFELAERNQDEVGRLALAFAHLQKTLTGYLHHLTEATAAQERIASELRIASEIQRGLLPEQPDFQDPGGRVELCADLQGAREVGGDLYDYFLLEEDLLAVVIGDVSDKGVAAALFGAVTCTLFKATAGPRLAASADAPSVGELMSDINRKLHQENRNFMFVTLIFGVLDLRSGRFWFVNAGHNPIFRVDSEKVERLPDRHGPPLGIRPAAGYPANEIQLDPGQTLVLYTDGITEAANPDGEQFSEERLAGVLREARQDSPRRLMGRVIGAVDHFVAGAPQSDDRALLIFRWLPLQHLGR